MKQLPNRRPISVRRKHREPKSTFDSDPEEEVYDRRDSNKSKPDITKQKMERSTCEVNNTEQVVVQSKVENLQNQFDSFGGKRFNTGMLEDCDHNIPNESRKVQASARGSRMLLGI